jgi:D-alanyl-D-alanine carboxypeptidase
LGDISWEDKVTIFLSGYYRVKVAAEKLGMYALLDTNLRNITSQHYVTANIYTRAGVRTQVIRNNNRLLNRKQNVDGIKVAQSRSAGSCLMVSSSRASVKRTNPTTGQPGTYGQRLLVVMLGMPSSNARYREAARFLRDGRNAWDAWLPTNDYQDRTKFIILPN